VKVVGHLLLFLSKTVACFYAYYFS